MEVFYSMALSATCSTAHFKGPAIDAECYLLSCGRYIEHNPVAAELVQERLAVSLEQKKGAEKEVGSE